MLADGAGRQALAEARDWSVSSPSTDAEIALAQALVAVGDVDQAEGIAYRLVESASPPRAAIALWAQLLIERQCRPQDVVERLRQLAEGDRVDPVVSIWLARGLAATHRHDEAIEALQAAVAHDPGDVALRMELGTHLMRNGRIAAAHANFMRATERDPCNASALRIAGYEHAFKAGDALFKRIETALSGSSRWPLQARVEIEYAAAKAFEDLGDFARAFTHYTNAGSLQKQLRPWSAKPLARLTDLIEGGFGAETARRGPYQRPRERAAGTGHWHAQVGDDFDRADHRRPSSRCQRR